MRNKDNNKIVEINRKRRIMKKKKTIKNKIFVPNLHHSVRSFVHDYF